MGRLAAAILLGLLAAWLTVQPPRGVAADAPARDFSSGRAMADIAAIADAPHPAGSDGDRRVRDYLIGRMTALGLQPRVQRDDAFALHDDGMGGRMALGETVENLVGVLPGRDRSAPALLLMAHYDAAPGSPGAGDDGAGVAAILETVRALKARGVPARDVAVLLSDGEEQGSLGAQAFFARDPLAPHVGLVINLEARGGAGPAVMFETSAANGALIDAFAGASVRPFSGSLANFVYQRMPNGTDLTAAKAAGKAGLNFAFMGAQFDYHAPTATAARLSQGSVQSMGAQLLAAAARFADGPLPSRAPDKVFSQVFGPLIVAYPPWAGWLPVGAAAALTLLAAMLMGRREPLRPGAVALGLLAGVAILAGAAGLLWLARAATGVSFGFLEQRPLLARFWLWETAMALAAAAAVTAVGALLGRRGSWLGLLAGAVLAAAALQAWQPLVAYAVAWPLALATLAAVAVAALGERGRWGIAALWAAAALAALSLGWIGGLAHFVALGLDLPWALAPFAWLAALGLWPLLEPLRGRRGLALALALLLAAGGVVGVLRFVSPWSARTPRASQVVYVADRDSGRFWRATPAVTFDDWEQRVLTADGGALRRRALPPLYRQPVVAAAAPVRHPAYEVSLSQADDCTVTVAAPWIDGATTLNLDLRSAAPATGATLSGRPAPLLETGGRWNSLHWRRMDGGLQATFRPAAPGRVEARYALQLDAWPADAKPLPPRPPEAMAWGETDALVLMGSTALEARGCG